MGFDNNVYYHPEKYGLRTIGELDPAESYEFDTFVVFQEVEGDRRFFWAHDSGCSCPTPFEDLAGIGDLTRLLTVRELREAIRNQWPPREHGWSPSPQDVDKLVEDCIHGGLAE